MHIFKFFSSFLICILIHFINGRAKGTVSKTKLRSKILGGRESRQYNDFPFMLSLEGNGYHLCGAAIIASMWAVTAAHCVMEYWEPGFEDIIWTLRAGSIIREKNGTVHNVLKIVPHERFGKMAFSDDIALLKVSKSFRRINKYVKPIRLPLQNEELHTGSLVTALGWGKTSVDSDVDFSEKLNYVTLEVIDNGICKITPLFEHIKIAAALKYDVFDSRKMFCAFSPRSDTTQGDSGGPVIYGKGKNAKLVGIVSWGEGTGDSPGVYTRVATYKNWIYSYIFNTTNS